ncbi:MAG: hypothetical protein RL156_1733 [Bacteroidota bacterium]|jgi:hypothetical protein
MQAQLIARFTNHRDGLEGRVYRLNDGRLSVVLFDLGAFEAVPSSRIYSPEKLDAAHTYARLIAGV